jgi:hypothetical protein
MANFSPDRSALESLAARVASKPNERFDPIYITMLDPKDPSIRPLYLKQTAALRTGVFTVAEYVLYPEAVTRATTEDIIHHDCDFAVLHRRIDRTNVRELSRARELAYPRGLDATRHAWAFELLKPVVGIPGALAGTGESEPYIPAR